MGTPIAQMALHLSHTNSRLPQVPASSGHHIADNQNKSHQQKDGADLIHLNHYLFARLTLFESQYIQDGLHRISKLVMEYPNSGFWIVPNQYYFQANRHTGHF